MARILKKSKEITVKIAHIPLPYPSPPSRHPLLWAWNPHADSTHLILSGTGPHYRHFQYSRAIFTFYTYPDSKQTGWWDSFERNIRSMTTVFSLNASINEYLIRPRGCLRPHNPSHANDITTNMMCNKSAFLNEHIRTGYPLLRNASFRGLLKYITTPLRVHYMHVWLLQIVWTRPRVPWT